MMPPPVGVFDFFPYWNGFVFFLFLRPLASITSSLWLASSRTGTFQALLLLRIPANSFCLAACISRAAVVSVWAPARRSRSWMVMPGLRYPAKPGSCRRISHGVAYHR